MTDYGTRQTDLAVKRTEWRLSRVYRQAARDIENKMSAWQKGHEAREAKYRQMVKDGKMSQADFDAWMRGQVFQGKQWQARKEQIQQTLLNADKTAANIVNEGKLGVFADNANYIGYSLEKGGKVDTGFTLYDENTVARLIKSDPKILPKAAPGVKKDKAYTYYNKLMNSAITQGIVQGETIPEIAKRIANVTGERSYSSAVRNARTAYTGAQNAGRIEGMHQAQGLGIKVKKQWMATLDKRTRDTHADLDGTVEDVDEPFVTSAGNEIMYPGDPDADPSEVYNCRCTLVYVYPKYPSSMERRDNETGEIVGDMTFAEWIDRKTPEIDLWRNMRQESTFASDQQSRRDMGELIETFGISNPIISKRDITEFYQYAEQTNGIRQTRDKKGNVHDHVTKKANAALNQLVDKLTDRIYETDADAQRDYTELKSFFRKTPLYMSEQDRSNISDFNQYKKSKDNFVRVTLDKGAISIDEIYEDLLESYPGRFNTEVKDVTEKLLAINQAMAEMDGMRQRSIRDMMSEDDLKQMRDDMQIWLLSGYEAAKSR